MPEPIKPTLTKDEEIHGLKRQVTGLRDELTKVLIEKERLCALLNQATEELEEQSQHSPLKLAS